MILELSRGFLQVWHRVQSGPGDRALQGHSAPGLQAGPFLGVCGPALWPLARSPDPELLRARGLSSVAQHFQAQAPDMHVSRIPHARPSQPPPPGALAPHGQRGEWPGCASRPSSERAMWSRRLWPGAQPSGRVSAGTAAPACALLHDGCPSLPLTSCHTL